MQFHYRTSSPSTRWPRPSGSTTAASSSSRKRCENLRLKQLTLWPFVSFPPFQSRRAADPRHRVPAVGDRGPDHQRGRRRLRGLQEGGAGGARRGGLQPVPHCQCGSQTVKNLGRNWNHIFITIIHSLWQKSHIKVRATSSYLLLYLSLRARDNFCQDALSVSLSGLLPLIFTSHLPYLYPHAQSVNFTDKFSVLCCIHSILNFKFERRFNTRFENCGDWIQVYGNWIGHSNQSQPTRIICDGRGPPPTAEFSSCLSLPSPDPLRRGGCMF